MDQLNGHIMNLANSIIGVSVLAMPYCFKQCGIILSVVLLVISSIISRLTCHFLLKSAILSRRKTFEYLAFHLFGGLGKLIIEIGLIGFLLGTCIAYFVVIGDLGPLIIAEVTKYHVTSTMHTSILLSLAVFIVLPLGLLRNIHSLNGVSKATMIFYCCLVLRVILEALPHLFEENWYKKVNLWKPEGILQCLPIFSYSLFCQTQLFEIYEVVPSPSLAKMNGLIKAAINFCTAVYICVGIFGYIAFADKNFTGNVLLSFEPSIVSHIMKVGFILSVAFSFPLSIFPCRASLYSLLYREGFTHEGNLNYIPEGKFKALTIIIVFVSLIIAILIPNIELVLGLIGSTIGVIICVLFPVVSFIYISQKNTNERIFAQILLFLGIFVMVVGTYTNIQRVDHLEPSVVTAKIISKADENMDKITAIVNKLPLTEKLEIKTELPKKGSTNLKEIRHEPPQPVEPVEEEPKVPDKPKLEKKIELEPPKKIESTVQKSNLVNDTVDIEAIKKEDKEEQLEKRESDKEIPKEEYAHEHKKLIDSIVKQNEVQKEIVEQQKQLLEVIKQQQKKEEDKKLDEVKQEKMKAVKEIESIALKAIEKISDGEDSKKVVDDLKKGIEKNEREISDKIPEKRSEAAEIKPKIDEAVVENKKAKEFEKNVDNFKHEIQELSSQLNQANIEIKNNDIKNADFLSKKEPLNNVNEENKLALNEVPFIDKKIKEKEQKEKENKPKIEDRIAPVPNFQNNQPLYLKLGNKEVKFRDEKDPTKLLPIPLVISNSILKKNETKLNNLPLGQTKEDKIELIEKKQAEEVQAMRRDILSVSTN